MPQNSEVLRHRYLALLTSSEIEKSLNSASVWPNLIIESRSWRKTVLCNPAHLTGSVADPLMGFCPNRTKEFRLRRHSWSRHLHICSLGWAAVVSTPVDLPHILCNGCFLPHVRDRRLLMMFPLRGGWNLPRLNLSGSSWSQPAGQAHWPTALAERLRKIPNAGGALSLLLPTDCCLKRALHSSRLGWIRV